MVVKDIVVWFDFDFVMVMLLLKWLEVFGYVECVCSVVDECVVNVCVMLVGCVLKDCVCLVFVEFFCVM